MRKLTIGLFALIAVSTGIYLAGPSAGHVVLSPQIQPLDIELFELDTWVRQKEENVSNLKPDNEARIYWHDSVRQTDYALVYLHGFSASQGEGHPIHLEVARRYGMNAFLARLDQHGLESEQALLKMTPFTLLESAKEAVAIGQKLGKKVILMSCSTGSTLALYLAAHNPDAVHGLICYSPNIDMYNQATHLLDGPWGLQIARLAEGGDYHSWEAPPPARPYWHTKYRIEALVSLRQLVDATMQTETFKRIDDPLLVLYYYKSEEEKDMTVSIEAMQEMYEQVSTPADQKRMLPVPEAGYHVLSSQYISEDLETVRDNTYDFAEEILGLKPIANTPLEQ